MTWNEMHIGIDLGLQALNSNLFNRLEPQAKDFLINRVIRNMIKNEVYKVLNNKDNFYSFDDIKRTSSLLAPLTRIIALDKFTEDSKYDYINIPKDITPITSGKLYAGRIYKVTTVGTTDLTSFGGGNPTSLNTIFTCTIANKTADALEIGAKYRILSVGTTVYTSAGAPNNMIGTEFIATTIGNGDGIVTPLNETPTWAGSTSLILTTNESLFELLTSFSNIDTTLPFATGSLKKGVTYRIVTGGTISNLTLYGATYNSVEPNYSFTCTQDGTPLWGTSGITMAATKTITNKLVLNTDIHNLLQNSFGTVTSSPLSTLYNGKLLVYHDGKINLNSIIIAYIVPHIAIDSVNNIDTDIMESFHDDIVDNTVQYIMSRTANPSYQAVLTENIKNNL